MPFVGGRSSASGATAAAHLWNVCEDVQPKRMVPGEERAFAGTKMVGEPERDAALAPRLPTRIGSEPRLDAEPAGEADRGERGERERRRGATDRGARQAIESGSSNDPNRDREGGVELERVAARLGGDGDPRRLLGAG